VTELEWLVNQIDQEIRVLSDDLASGNAKTYEEYKHSCGAVRGLLIARTKVVDLSERINESE
jgi:hypothetical protein